ncbi:nucleotidyl transferase AbiEii/AbiGii toxin family protein [bacterium]|nr:nucleotidyl transferase AbiEii/AbiGii toxin family protein [bacterium]
MLRFDAVPGSVRALLLRLAPLAALQDFALGGGSSLALRFAHRLSVDLDFFTVGEFVPDALFDRLELDGATIIAQAANSLTLDVNGVKLDLLRHAYRVLQPVEKIDGITLVSLPDLAAMKLNAIANRGSKKDFFDFVELLDHFPIQRMIECFSAKYPATDPFTVIRSLAWFEDAEIEPEPLSMTGLKWHTVKATVSKAVAGL